MSLCATLLKALNVFLLSCCESFALECSCTALFCLSSGSTMDVLYTEIFFSGRREVTGRRGRRRKQLLVGLKEKRGYWKLKEKAPYQTVCRTRLGEGTDLP